MVDKVDFRPMTDAEIAESVAGVRCAVCGMAKSVNVPFCPTDFAALPLRDRLALDRIKGFDDSFRAAFRHLALNPARRQFMPGRSGEWAFRTVDELKAAGYRFQSIADCRAPRCGAEVAWYRTPRDGWVAVSLVTCQPHVLSCADPGWRDRRKERQEAKRAARLQASARRKKGGAR